MGSDIYGLKKGSGVEGEYEDFKSTELYCLKYAFEYWYALCVQLGSVQRD